MQQASTMPTRTPSYRYHKAPDCAVVAINGKNHYLGTFNSDQSWEKYHRLLGEALERQQSKPFN